jgi:hypothetical protein
MEASMWRCVQALSGEQLRAPAAAWWRCQCRRQQEQTHAVGVCALRRCCCRLLLQAAVLYTGARCFTKSSRSQTSCCIACSQCVSADASTRQPLARLCGRG